MKQAMEIHVTYRAICMVRSGKSLLVNSSKWSLKQTFGNCILKHDGKKVLSVMVKAVYLINVFLL